MTQAGLYVLIISLLTFSLIFGVNLWVRKKQPQATERGVL